MRVAVLEQRAELRVHGLGDRDQRERRLHVAAGLDPAARDGDREAYELLVDHVTRPLFRVAHRILRDLDAAEDAVQRARDTEGTVVMDFRVEQEDSVYPMVPAGADLHAMIRRPEKSALVETAADPI